jgi:sugar transferase (PEP-CTERM/EpsH1 system associated)
VKPALIFLCQRTPFPPIKGDRITTYNFLRHLATRYRVYLGTFYDDPADAQGIAALEAMVEGLHIEAIRKPWAFGRALPRWLAGEPVSFALFRSGRLERWLRDVWHRHSPQAIVAYSSNVATYAVDAIPARAGVRRVLIFADVDSEKFSAYAERARGLRRWIFRLEARRVAREERRLSQRGDAVTLVTEEEAALFRSIHGEGAANVVVLPNGVDTSVFDPARYPDAPFAAGGPVFVFTGAMDYPPNVEAVDWFTKEVFPKLRRAFEGARFMIVGSNPSPRVRQLGEAPGVVVTGRVPSTAAYLAHASVAVAPLRIARGVQNKVLEAMAMARPIVATEAAMTGLAAVPGRDLLCAESAAEWVDACVRLLSDAELATRMGRAARRLVEQNYNWEAQFSKLDAMLER